MKPSLIKIIATKIYTKSRVPKLVAFEAPVFKTLFELERNCVMNKYVYNNVHIRKAWRFFTKSQVKILRVVMHTLRILSAQRKRI